MIDNRNAGVKAMVAGPDFEEKPFNLATMGHRQPGSSIKPFILAAALEQGISSGSVYESGQQVFTFGRRDKEFFEVNNYEDSYLGSASLATATTYSDNSVYAQVGLEGLEARHPRRSPAWPTAWESRPTSRPTRRGARRASRSASRRWSGPTPSPPSPTTATGSAAPSPPTRATAPSPTPR